MEARVFAARATLTLCAGLFATQLELQAASYRTANFVVEAPTQEFAERVGQEAERFRKELSEMWAGKNLPNWSAPCPIRCKVGQIGAGGATTFNFQNGEVLGWRMNIQGTEERILDSVLPHEITHTILACIFRRPLPRWADEGMSTLIEHESERRRQTRLLDDVMRGGKKIPLQSLLGMTEYPSDMRDVMKLYAQGYSLTDYLVQQGGRRTFLAFLQDAHRKGNWDHALSAHYGVNSVGQLEQKWDSWVIAGSPSLNLPEGNQLALNENRIPEGTVVRGQSPELNTPATSAPTPIASQNVATASAPERNHQMAQLDSAPAYNATNRTAQPDREETTMAGSYQTSRSRSELVQPIYVRTVNHVGNLADRKDRSPLVLTREGFTAPQTPLRSFDTVNPFGGIGQADPFTP